MAERCNFALTTAKTNEDVTRYGRSYLLVAKGRGDQYIQYLSPWRCEMSDDEDTAMIYKWDEANKREVLTLIHLDRDADGNPSKVWARNASREAEDRTLVAPNDDELVKRIGETYDTDSPRKWVPSTEFTWDGERTYQGYEYALACGHIPVIRQRDEDMQGEIVPHLPTLLRINQGIFDRMCITMMQAFKQRAIKGIKRTVYTEDDPQVRAGLKNVGDDIDYGSLFKAGPMALWMLPPDCEVWESSVTDIRPLVEAESSDIKHLAAATRTPLDILSPDVAGSAAGANLKGDGLILKVKSLNRLANATFTLAVKMALVLDGHEEAASQHFSTVFMPPAPPDFSTLSQACANFKGILSPLTMRWYVLNMTDEEQARARQDEADTQWMQQFSQVLSMQDDRQQSEQVGELPSALGGEDADLGAESFDSDANSMAFMDESGE